MYVVREFLLPVNHKPTQLNSWSPTMGRLAVSSTSSRVCRGGSGAEGRTLGHFTVLFITPEDMSLGMSHTRTSTHTYTKTHTHPWWHPKQPGWGTAVYDRAHTSYSKRLAWGGGCTPMCMHVRAHAIFKEALQHVAITSLVLIYKGRLI